MDKVMNDKFYSGKSLNDLVKEVEIDVIWCHRSGGLVVFLYPFRRRFILSEVRIRPEWIEISGHAGYAESGKDIVCASITAFTQTLNKSVEGLTMRCARVGIQIKPIKSASFQKSLRIFFRFLKLIWYSIDCRTKSAHRSYVLRDAWMSIPIWIRIDSERSRPIMQNMIFVLYPLFCILLPCE